MHRFKLSAILLSLLARLGLAEPNYSILDESSNRWLPDDTLLTGLNTIYNSITQGLQDKDDKKRRPMSVLAAAIVEYLSSDLIEEQDRLNTALSVIARRVPSKHQDEDFLRNKVINENDVTRTPDVLRVEDNPDSKGHLFDDVRIVTSDTILKNILDTRDNVNNVNGQYYKYGGNSLTDDTKGKTIKTSICS